MCGIFSSRALIGAERPCLGTTPQTRTSHTALLREGFLLRKDLQYLVPLYFHYYCSPSLLCKGRCKVYAVCRLCVHPFPMDSKFNRRVFFFFVHERIAFAFHASLNSITTKNPTGAAGPTVSVAARGCSGVVRASEVAGIHEGARPIVCTIYRAGSVVCVAVYVARRIRVSHVWLWNIKRGVSCHGCGDVFYNGALMRVKPARCCFFFRSCNINNNHNNTNYC